MSIQNRFHLNLIIYYSCFYSNWMVFKVQDSILSLHSQVSTIFSFYCSNWRNQFLIFIKVMIQPLLFFNHCILFSCCYDALLSCFNLHLNFAYPFIRFFDFIVFFAHWNLLLAESIYFCYCQFFSQNFCFKSEWSLH